VEWRKLVSEWGREWVSEFVRGLLQLSPCELLLLEAGSWGTGTIWEPSIRGRSTIGSCYQATTDEDKADWEDLVSAVVNCSVCELVTVLHLLVVTICKWSVNPITNPNPIYSNSYVPQYWTEAPEFKSMPQHDNFFFNFTAHMVSIPAIYYSSFLLFMTMHWYILIVPLFIFTVKFFQIMMGKN
jgi:hypothetical protein